MTGLDGATGGIGTPQVRRSPGFVGREAELRHLQEALEPEGAVVAVEGEAGVGKTRLAMELLAAPSAAEKSLFVVCPPFREPFPLGPIVAALRSRQPDIASLGLDPLGGALRPLFPEWAADLPPAPEPLQDARAGRHRLFAAVAQLIDSLGVSLLVADDVQWADEATLELLTMLASRPRAGLRLLLLYRTDEVADSALLRLTAGAVKDRVVLHTLDIDGTTALVSSMLHDEPVADSLTRYLHARTEGLPLAIEESVRLLSGRADLRRSEDGWRIRRRARFDVPPVVRDSVLARTQPLSAAARRVLQAAAVLAQPADEAMLAEVAGLPADDVHAGLGEAVRAGLLTDDEQARFGFRHVLAATAIYEEMPRLERRPMHARAGEALARTEPPPVAWLVHHFRRANDLVRWASYAERAADLAMAASDDASGIGLLVELVTEAGLPVPQRVEAAKKLAGIEVFRRSVSGATMTQVVDALQQVISLPEVDDVDKAEIGSPMGRLLMQLGDFEAGRAELERAIPRLEGNPAEAARAMMYLGWPYGSDWPAGRHIEWLRRAATIVPDTMPRTERLRLTVDRMTSLLLLGEESGWRLLRDIPTQADSVQEVLQAARGHGNAGYTAMLWGRFDEARDRLQAALTLVEAGRFERVREPILATVAHLDWLTGHWDGLDRRVAEIVDVDGERLPQLEGILVWCLLAASAGDVDAAADRLLPMIRELQEQRVPDLHAAAAALLGRIRLQTGDVDAALADTEEPIREITTKGAWLWATEILPVRVQALCRADRIDEARLLVAACARGIRPQPPPAPAAALAQSRAVLAQARAGSPEAVADAFAEAADAWAVLPRPYDALLAREQQAAAVADAHDQEAVQLLGDVRVGLADLGAHDDAERVANLLRGLGVPVPRRQRGGRRGYGDQLSPREIEVVKLLVDGRTNREIGEVLVLSPKTVARHLDSARRKLGVSSRTALAVKAVDAGIVS